MNEKQLCCLKAGNLRRKLGSDLREQQEGRGGRGGRGTPVANVVHWCYQRPTQTGFPQTPQLTHGSLLILYILQVLAHVS